MPIGFKIWFIAAGVLGVIWLARVFAAGYARKNRRILRAETFRGPPEPAPKVSIVVAAKDEEANIEACIRSLLAQDYPDFEMIAVNDRSSDRTLEILRRLEREAGSKLAVVNVESVREGWFGKSNAMREGLALAVGEWLLMTDADCRLTSPRTLSTGMREALLQEADFLSIYPVLETLTVWEKIIQPVAALVLIRWFLPQRINDRGTSTAYANAMFMLVKHSVYKAIGGHEPVKTEFNEDIKLARNVKRHGFHLRVAENDGLLVSRMYRSPSEAWRGWSRIYYGSLDTVGRLSVSMLMIVVNSFTPYVSLVVGLVGLATAEPGQADLWRQAVIGWAAVVALAQIAMLRFYGVMRVGRAWSLTYILGVSAAFGMLASAALKAMGLAKTTWRGTTYLGDRLVGGGTSTS